MAIIGFTQDPQAPKGMGDFHFDNGQSLYAHDPETAAAVSQSQQQPMQPSPELVQAAQPGQDMRVAGPGGGMPDYEGQTDAQNMEALGKMRLGQGAAKESNEKKAVENHPEPTAASKPPSDIIQPGQGLDNSQREQNIAAFLKRPMVGGGGKPRLVPKSESIETETPPDTPEAAAARADLHINTLLAKQQTAQTLQQRAQAEQLQYQAALPGLQQKAAAAQKQVDMQHTAYQQERADLQEMMDKSQANEAGFNANHWFESKGAVGQLATVIAQAFGAYASTLSGGENWVQKQINGYIDQDIANQKQQIESGRKNVDNALQRLKLRYGDMDQAEAALKMAMTNSADAQAKMMAAGNQSEDVQNAWNEFHAQSEQDFNAAEQKFQTASYGKHKLDLTMQTPGGPGNDLVAKAKQLKALGVSDEEIARVIFGQGGARTGDAVVRGNVATIHGVSREFDTPDAAVEAKKAIDTGDLLHQKLARAEQILAHGAESNAEQGELVRLQNEIGPMMTKYLLSAQRPNQDLSDKTEKALGDFSADFMSQTGHDWLGRFRAAIGTMRGTVSQMQKDALEGGVQVERSLGENEKGQRATQFRYKTAPTTMQDVEQ